MKKIRKLNISTLYRAPFDNVKISRETHLTMMVRVRSRERYFKCVVTLSFPLSYCVDENESSRSYRAIFSSKNPEELSYFLGVESANNKSSLLVEGNGPKL